MQALFVNLLKYKIPVYKRCSFKLYQQLLPLGLKRFNPYWFIRVFFFFLFLGGGGVDLAAHTIEERDLFSMHNKLHLPIIFQTKKKPTMKYHMKIYRKYRKY